MKIAIIIALIEWVAVAAALLAFIVYVAVDKMKTHPGDSLADFDGPEWRHVRAMADEAFSGRAA